MDTKGLQETSSYVASIPLVFLWMNTGCNARCLMCEIWKNHSKVRLSAAEIRGWAPDWQRAGVLDVELCGESTLHPELWEICAILAAHSLNVHLLTNGLRLKHIAEQVARHATSVTVSLDGPAPIHDQVRNVPRAFQRLAFGLQSLRGFAPDIRVDGRCAVHKLNFRSLRSTVDTAHELGLSSISFLALDTTSDAFGRSDLADFDDGPVSGMTLVRDDLPLLEGELSALQAEYGTDFASGYIRESPRQLRDVLLSYYASACGLDTYRPRTLVCNAPWTSAVIEPSGLVRPCFFLPAYGNLRSSRDLPALINSAAARGYRERLDVNTHPICRRCICPRHVEVIENGAGRRVLDG